MDRLPTADKNATIGLPLGRRRSVFAPNQTDVGGRILVLVPGRLSSDEVTALGARYRKVWSDLVREKRRTLFVRSTAVWLLPSLALYALGWSIAWVRRGF